MIVVKIRRGQTNVKIRVAVPTVSIGTYEFTGEEQGPEITGLNESQILVTGQKAVDAGPHVLTLSLRNKKYMIWDDDGTTDDKTYTYTIGEITVDKPTVTVGTYTFDFNEHGPAITGLNETCVDVSGNNMIEAGNYNLTLALKNKTSMKWSDGKTDDLVYPYSIAAASIAKPSASNTSFTYNKDEHYPTVTVDEKYVDYDKTKKTAAGNYSIVFSLKNKKSSAWSGGGTEDIPVAWEIKPYAVTAPNVQDNTQEYSGNLLTPSISVDETLVDVSGNEESTIGNYTAVYSLKDKANYVWKDTGTTADKEIAWEITKRQISFPTVTNTSFGYDGDSHLPTITYDSQDKPYITENAVAQTDACETNTTYSVSFTLKDTEHNAWADGNTSTTRAVNWKITQARGTLSLSKYSVAFNKSSTQTTVTASGYHGALSAESSNTGVATVSVSGSTITVSAATSKGNSSTTITVTSAATRNYTAASATVSVSASFITIDTFANTVANGKLAEIADALNDSENPLTTSELGWSVGDEAYAYVGSTRYIWTILNIGGKEFTDGTTCHYAIGLKNMLTTMRPMNSTNKSSSSWAYCDMRTYCNGDFRNSLSSDFQNAFRQFTNYTDHDGNRGFIDTTYDYFALAAEAEIFGKENIFNSTNGEAARLNQFEYYKKYGALKTKGDYGDYEYWLERSPCSYSSPYGVKGGFCCVNSNGEHSASDATISNGVSPFGCI